MEHEIETEGIWGTTGLWLARNEGMEKKMDTSVWCGCNSKHEVRIVMRLLAC